MKDYIFGHLNKRPYCSIKSVEDVYSDRLFLRNKVAEFSKACSHIILICMRPLNVICEAISYIEATQPEIIKKSIDKNYFHICILIKNNPDSDFYLDLCVSAWFEYEHPAILFFNANNENEAINVYDILNADYFLGFDSILNISKGGYLFFKMAEDDVVWIVKSSDYEWPKELHISKYF